jgi:peptide/nickel transport system permease protein
MAFRKAKKSVDLELSGEQAIFNKETEGLSQGQIVFRRFVRHKAAMTSVVVLASLITMVFTALETKSGQWTIPGWWKHGFDELLERTPSLHFIDHGGGRYRHLYCTD